MSRTYHHGRLAKTRLLADAPFSNWPHNPGWFTRLTMTRPARRKTGALLHKLHTLMDIEDAPLFPHPTKPHRYYW